MVLTVRVEVPDPPGTELGLNEHTGVRVTVGVMLLQDKLTAPLKPFCAAMVIVEVADAPSATVAGESGVAATVKSAGPVTVKLTEVLWLSEPPVPVTVRLKVPAGVVPCVVIVRVEVPVPPGTAAGTNAQVGGGVTTGVMLLHDRFTALLNPASGAMVIVEVADPPCTIVAGDAAEAAIVKSGAAVTVRPTEVL